MVILQGHQNVPFLTPHPLIECRTFLLKKVYCNQHLVYGWLDFNVGIGVVPLFLLSEYLPLNVRGIAGGIAAATTWLSGILVTGVYFSYVELVGDVFVWWTIPSVEFYVAIRMLTRMEATFNGTANT